MAATYFDRRGWLLVAGALAAVLAIHAAGEVVPPAAPIAVTPSNPAEPPLEDQPQKQRTPVSSPALAADDVSGIRVHGTLRQDGRASAIISEGGGPQRRVAMGSELRPGMMLADVAPGYIVAEQGGARIRLPIARFGETDRPSMIDAEPALADNPAMPSRASFSGALAKRRTLAFQLGLSEVRSGELTVGFRVDAADEMPLFSAAGLRDGDVVTAINGNPFNDEEKVVELADELAQSKSLGISYQRGGVAAEARIRFGD